MRTSIIKQILFAVFCVGFGWYLSAWWADISHKPFAFFSFGFLTLFLPVLSLVYIGIHNRPVRRIFLGLMVLHYLLLAAWILSLGDQPMPSDTYLAFVTFVGYAITQIGAWHAYCRSAPKSQKVDGA